MRYLIIIGSILLLSACQESNFKSTCPSHIEEKLVSRQTLITKTHSDSLRIDSLKLLNIYQSDVNNLMMNHIIFKDGRFTLTLSERDINTLGISIDIYMKYLEYVDELNQMYTGNN